MGQEIFWLLLSKKLSGEATDKELKELEQLIGQHPEWQYAIQNLEDFWKHPPQKDSLQEEDAYMLHLHRMNELNIPFDDRPAETPVSVLWKQKKLRWYGMAASLAIIIGLFMFSPFSTAKTDRNTAVPQMNEISTRMGSRSKVQLPDGSVVWLNAGSQLLYDKEYGKETREVTLTGEGFFDVVKQKDKPFLIHTENINIKVLGTTFNVKAYPQDKQTETSLIRGSIEVTIKNRPQNKIILSPHEKLIVENETLTSQQGSAKQDIQQPAIAIHKLQYDPVDSSVAETGWVQNRLVVRDESLAELALKMERWYNVQIEIRDQTLSQKRLSVTFENETIDQALEALRESIPFHYEKKGINIILNR